MTPYQTKIHCIVIKVAKSVPIFTALDIADQLIREGEIVSRTSAIEVALNYLAAARHLILLRKGVYRLVAVVAASRVPKTNRRAKPTIAAHAEITGAGL